MVGFKYQDAGNGSGPGKVAMTVNDLIEILQDAADEGHGDKNLIIAEQPNYPLAAIFKGVYVEEVGNVDFEDEEPAVWLVSGANTSSRNPYSVPRDAWDDYIG